MTPEERFWRLVDKSGDCWVWTGARTAPGWHGRFNLGPRAVMAHRFSWELVHGPIPEGLVVCHSCDNPPCVRTAHLFLGTQRANMVDASRKGRMVRKVATHCKRGHAFTEANTIRHNKTGRRQCRQCRNASHEVWLGANPDAAMRYAEQRRRSWAANRDWIAEQRRQGYRAARDAGLSVDEARAQARRYVSSTPAMLAAAADAVSEALG